MARERDEPGSRYQYYHQYPDEEAERRHRRRHRSRDYNEASPAKRDRRERRRPDEARREAELDVDDWRARTESNYRRSESQRRRDQGRMAQEIRDERVRDKPRGSRREVGRDGTRRAKKEAVADDRSDDFVYARPASRGAVGDMTDRRGAARKRSDQGASSSRTAFTPLSGSASTPSRRVEDANLMSMSSREPAKGRTPTKSSLRRTTTLKLPPTPPVINRMASTRDSTRRSAGGILSSFFRPPQRTLSASKEAPRVDCLVCMNDGLPTHKTVKLACGHRMCHSCLRRQFTLSVQDPQHMPPRCCTTDNIPLKYAERLFDDKFKILWNKKYEEYTTSNRLYCPTKGCGQWIKPSRIRMDLTYGRKYARCASCNTKVCVLCNSKFHTRRECPKDEETKRLVEMAKEKGWQRCYSCKAVVELKEGCNHMTCRCTAQFCMVCAAPWKSCNCPWFNYQHIEDEDRLNEMQVPYTANSQDFVQVVEVIEEPSPPLARRSSTRNRHRSSTRQSNERADQVLSAHLRASLRLESTPTTSGINRSDPAVQVYGVGNTSGHHVNESYAIRALPTSAARTAARSAAPRASFFSRDRHSARESTRSTSRPAAASVMAGLSRDGKKIGANRVGTWLNHIQVDPEAIATAPKNVEVDDWRCDGTMIGID